MPHPTTLETNRTSPASAEDDSLYEVIDGERKELEPMGAIQVMLASALTEYMGLFARQNKLGAVVTEMLFVLDAERGLQRRPDVAFVSYPRWPEPTVPNSNAWNVVPDLVVEVVSPTNLAEEIDTRVTNYFAAGVRLVWVLYPDSGHVYVHDSSKHCAVLERSEALDGGDVLPGFQLPIETLFEAVTRPE